MSYSLLINEVYWGYNPLILTFDPNFLGHPSMGKEPPFFRWLTLPGSGFPISKYLPVSYGKIPQDFSWKIPPKNWWIFHMLYVPSLKLGASLPLKIDGWKISFLLGCHCFRYPVSFRERKFTGVFSPLFCWVGKKL